LRDANGHSVVPPSADLTITTDASKMGWGATNQKLSTRGVWTREENQAHINLLEMKAVLLAFKSLVSLERNIHIQLFINNSTTIAYLNHRGGMHSKALSDLAVEIWLWCLERGISILAEHIPGVYNLVADAESRMALDPSNWKLMPSILARLQTI